MEEILKLLLEAQEKTNAILLSMTENDESENGLVVKKVGEIAVIAAGANLSTSFDLPPEMENISFFAIETNSKDLLLKRASVGLSIDGYNYFEKDIPAKTFYFPEYNEARMLDLKPYTGDGKPINLKSRRIEVSVQDDSSVSNPAFAPYKIAIYVRGKSSKFQ